MISSKTLLSPFHFTYLLWYIFHSIFVSSCMLKGENGLLYVINLLRKSQNDSVDDEHLMNMYELLFHHYPDPVYILDVDGNMIALNSHPRFCAGKSLNEAVE
jgi:hypothetical protein